MFVAAGASLRPAHLHVERSRPCVIVVASFAPWARLPVGCLGAAFFPVAAAFADDYEIHPDPSSTETLTGVYGLENTASPAESGSILGYQEFEVLDTTTKQVVGTFYADESNSVRYRR